MISTTQPPKRESKPVAIEHLTTLLAQCEQNNEMAFEELYGLCSAQLYGVLVRILRIEAIAEEALQDTFVKIWQKAGTYRPDSGSPMAWMCSVARHQALDVLRKRGSRESHERFDVNGYIDATPDLAKPFHEMTEDAKLLMQCLERLPKDTRNCIIFAYCEGYSHEELAAQGDTPIGTVKSWIRRGLLSLRKCLDELA